jgi:hypothetical protein
VLLPVLLSMHCRSIQIKKDLLTPFSCNFFCCACPGVTTIISTVQCPENYVSRSEFFLTAPPDTTWTCRDRHSFTNSVDCSSTTITFRPHPTAFPTTKTTKTPDAGDIAITQAPKPTTAPKVPVYSFEDLAEYEAHFGACAGVQQTAKKAKVSIDQYLAYQNITDLSSDAASLARTKFGWHDIDGDGQVSFQEGQLLCDGTGCQ